MDSDNSDLLSLPNELLIKILSYIPARSVISLVCRKIYEIVCCIERNRFRLVLNDEKTLLDTVSFKSIINTQREFDSMTVKITAQMTELCWDRLRKIVQKHIPLHLTLSNFDPRRATATSLHSVFTQIPLNSLKELRLSNVSSENFSELFKCQNSIRILSVTGAVGSASALANLKLSKLKLVGPKSKELGCIIRCQKELNALKLTIDEETTYNNEVFAEILKLERLESLDVPLNEAVSTSSIRHLEKLKFLQKLSVSCSATGLQHLTRTTIPLLRELDILLDSPGLSNSIEILSQNISTLKCLKLRGPLVVNFLTSIASFFPNLESLWLENDESFFVNILSLSAPPSPRLKLKHLRIINRDKKFVICTNDLVKFLKAFSKLETLVITKNIDVHSNNFESILLHLPELKEIVIDSKSFGSTTTAMNIIKSYGHRLNFIGFEGFKLESDVESLSVFFEGKFASIKKQNGNLVLMNERKNVLGQMI